MEHKMANDEDFDLQKGDMSHHPKGQKDDQNQRAQEKRSKHDGKGEQADLATDQLVDEKHHKTNEMKKEEKKHEHEAHGRHDRVHKASDYSSHSDNA
ncbi:hypothetical protein RvY_02173 [Ramazzottius varieornatus]|uniref:Uncharacterized protein n=1 Tax=Ramazzottius varieornatus TaxID=947166 RepID=A0A1D1UMK1_RAMVA|nr:hypothetical protein RvY_02173 [Ramazzottius varieornatus]